MFNLKAATLVVLVVSVSFMGCERRVRPAAEKKSAQENSASDSRTGFLPYAECENVFGGDSIAAFRVERDAELKQSRIVVVNTEKSETFVKNDEGAVVLVSDEMMNDTGKKAIFVAEQSVEEWPMQIFIEMGPEISKWDLMASWGDIIRASYDTELNQPSGYQCKAL